MVDNPETAEVSNNDSSRRIVQAAMAQEISALERKVGDLSGGLLSVQNELGKHIVREDLLFEKLFGELKLINDTLSQAKGAQKIFVWLLATLFSAAALAKLWWK